MLDKLKNQKNSQNHPFMQLHLVILIHSPLNATISSVSVLQIMELIFFSESLLFLVFYISFLALYSRESRGKLDLTLENVTNLL